MAKQESSVIVHPGDLQSCTADIVLWFNKERFAYKNVVLTQGPIWLTTDYQTNETMPPLTVATTGRPGNRLLDRIEMYQVNVGGPLNCEINFVYNDRRLYMEDAMILQFSQKELVTIGTLKLSNDEIYNIFGPNPFRPVKARILPSFIRFEDLLEEEE